MDGAPAFDAPGAGDAGPVDDTADPEAVYDAFRRAACAQGNRCEALRPEDDIAAFYCHPGAKSPFWEMVLAAWRLGHADFDAAAARACLDSIDLSGPCVVPSWVPDVEACFETLTGNVPEGGACALGGFGLWSPECQDGLTCVTEGACPGVCARPSLEGEPCSRARQCASGHYCDDGLCVGRATLGEPCNADQCDVTLQCVDRVCSSVPELGEPCGGSHSCREMQRCEPDASGTLRCVAWSGAEGSPCQYSDLCDFPLVCWEPPGTAPTGGQLRCTRGVALGAPCDNVTIVCGPGGRCVDGACREIVMPESQCDDARVCPLSHRCVDSACVPLPSEGEPCDESGDRCFIDRCEGGVCIEVAPQAGEACQEYLFYCATGLHCREIDATFVCAAPCT